MLTPAIDSGVKVTVPSMAEVAVTVFFDRIESNGEAVATCYYGVNFAAVLEKENIFAVQFNPEKSGDPGAKLLENFLRLAAS